MTVILTNDRLDQIAAKVNEAKSKPDWQFHRSKDEEFLSAYRSDVPDLLGHIEELNKVLIDLRNTYGRGPMENSF